MYDAFDKFLMNDTWPKCGPADEQRFFDALGQVVRNPNFDPGEMGEYLRRRAAQTSGQVTQPLGSAIDHYVSGARTIRDYLVHITCMHP